LNTPPGLEKKQGRRLCRPLGSGPGRGGEIEKGARASGSKNNFGGPAKGPKAGGPPKQSNLPDT